MASDCYLKMLLLLNLKIDKMEGQIAVSQLSYCLHLAYIHPLDMTSTSMSYVSLILIGQPAFWGLQPQFLVMHYCEYTKNIITQQDAESTSHTQGHEQMTRIFLISAAILKKTFYLQSHVTCSFPVDTSCIWPQRCP